MEQINMEALRELCKEHNVVKVGFFYNRGEAFEKSDDVVISLEVAAKRDPAKNLDLIREVEKLVKVSENADLDITTTSNPDSPTFQENIIIKI